MTDRRGGGELFQIKQRSSAGRGVREACVAAERGGSHRQPLGIEGVYRHDGQEASCALLEVTTCCSAARSPQGCAAPTPSQQHRAALQQLHGQKVC